jgi:hypothetical protein
LILEVFGLDRIEDKLFAYIKFVYIYVGVVNVGESGYTFAVTWFI